LQDLAPFSGAPTPAPPIKRGIATPKEDMDIIHARLKIAEAFVKELRK
jgi:hypothetical protein